MKIKTLLLSSAFLLAGLSAQANVTSDFSVDADGWTIVDLNGVSDFTSVLGTFGVSHQGSGGNTGGFISASDPSSNCFYFSASSKFLGNKLSSYGLNLSYDFSYSNHAVSWFPHADVVLSGAGLTLVNDLSVAPTGTWTNYSVILGAGQGWKLSSPSGAFASEAQIKSVLGNLSALRINGEYTDGIVETAKLDNVVLGTNDRPVGVADTASTLGLLGFGLAALSFFRRQSRK